MNFFYANCKYENWDACVKHEIFGLKQRLPDIDPGDLILLRVTGHTGEAYGVRSIWRLEDVSKVEADTPVPWMDGEYRWILHCTPLAYFEKPFSEGFATSSKVSQKIAGLFATRIMGSVGALKAGEAASYLDRILAEMKPELERAMMPEGDMDVYVYLANILEAVRSESAPRGRATKAAGPREVREVTATFPSYGIVGQRIDLPVLNYAPLNEMGVILLFGYYLTDLGFSHLEEIRSEFPDAIGMQRIDDRKNRRVRIEFEYRSRNYIQHKHPMDGCDVIVCWENDWPDCPLEVIELRTALFQG
jgi:hypothetical protein